MMLSGLILNSLTCKLPSKVCGISDCANLHQSGNNPGLSSNSVAVKSSVVTAVFSQLASGCSVFRLLHALPRWRPPIHQMVFGVNSSFENMVDTNSSSVLLDKTTQSFPKFMF